MGKMGSYISVELTLFILYCLFPCHENNHWKNEKLVWSKPPHMLMEDSIFFFLFFFLFYADIDECKDKNGGCPHECLNAQGSYLCHCRDGYVTERNGTVCRPREYTVNKKMARSSFGNIQENESRPAFFHQP